MSDQTNEILGYTPTRDQLIEAAKAAGIFTYGTVTTDEALRVNGAAGVQQSLNKIVNRMTLSTDTASLFKSVDASKVMSGDKIYYYIDKTDVGMSRNSSVSTELWGSIEKSGNLNKKPIYVKDFAERSGTIDTSAKLAGAFVDQVAEVQTDMLTRMNATKARNTWSGLGDGLSGGAAPKQIKGVSAWIDDGNFDGTHVVDLRDNGFSGISGLGVNNPADLDNAHFVLANNVFNNDIGNPTLNEIWMSRSAAIDVDKGKANISTYQIIGAEPQNVAKGVITSGFTNRLAENGIMKIMTDGFILTGRDLKPSFTLAADIPYLLDSTYTPASVAVTVAAGSVSNKMLGSFVGSYRYWIVAIDQHGRESTFCNAGTAAPTNAIAYTSAQKGTIVISASSGGLETGYAIYRSHTGSVNDPDRCRLMKIVTKTGATTTYVDENFDLPGGEEIYLGNFSTPGFVQGIYTLPPTHIELPRSGSQMAVNPIGMASTYAQYLGKPRWTAKIKNYISPSSGWNVFTGF
jgi:hypothetical protein